MSEIEIISIGSELLTGKTINTNAAFISQKLRQIGLSVVRHTALSDNAEILKKELQIALHRSEIVITTGGLGPTFDDISKRVANSLFQSSLILNDKYYRDLQKRYKKFSRDLKEQATVPSNAVVFVNPIGTAPGLALPKEHPRLLMLPGVPKEMEALLEQSILPFLKKRFRKEEKCFEKELHFCLLWENDLHPILKKFRSPKIDIGIYPEYATVTVVLRTQAKIKQIAEAAFAPLVRKLKAHFQAYLYESKNGRLEEAICEQLTKAKQTLVLAESCTGGAISARLTSISGSSKYFFGSFVTYSDRLKHSILHVSKETLKKHGAVSKETVQEMLEGAFHLTGADYGIAVSGIAGPTGGTVKKPVGTIWFAIGKRKEKPDIGLIPLMGIQKRDVIIQYASTYALGLLFSRWINTIY
jgi:nicotinamide-nucleotide amidase